MCAKNKNIYSWREQAIVREIVSMTSIVACCHGAKLCAHAARDFRSQQYFVPRAGPSRCGTQCKTQARIPYEQSCYDAIVFSQPCYEYLDEDVLEK